MTDEAYDAQTLATSARIERLHRLRFGPQARTFTCESGHVNRASPWHFCGPCAGRAIKDALFSLYGLSDPEESGVSMGVLPVRSDPEELIYSRAN